MNQPSTPARAPLWLIGAGVVTAWWLAYLPLPFFSFYKEWIFVMALGLAMLLLKPLQASPPLFHHPLVIGATAIAAVLLLQGMTDNTLGPKAALMGGYLGFFVFAIAAGRVMNQQRDIRSLLWLAWVLVISALGSCFFAALQLNWIDFSIPLVSGRSVERIASNVAQANHFADLLWLGCASAALLHACGRLSVPVTGVLVAVLQTFSLFTGSRMVWLYAASLLVLGTINGLRRPQGEVKRLSRVFLTVGALFVVVAAIVSASGAMEFFGISSGAKRMVSADGEASSNQRLWLWHAAIDAAGHNPLLGVGVGRYVGSAHELVMRANGPSAGADSNAHNLFLHLAAELGVPLALFVAACVGWWVLRSWREASRRLEVLGVLALSGMIWIHASLEYPLWYAYFLGLLGLLAGHADPDYEPTRAPPCARSVVALKLAAVAVLAAATLSYLHVGHLEKAMQRVVVQVGVGGAPQSDEVLNSELASVPPWSPYRDFAEAIFLMTRAPTKENAADLATRCERAATFGPSPYLLARCASVFQAAGQAERATYFANSFCKLYPDSTGVLIDSMTYSDSKVAGAGDVKSSCVTMRD